MEMDNAGPSSVAIIPTAIQKRRAFITLAQRIEYKVDWKAL